MTPALLNERPAAPVAAPPEDATRREFIIGVGSAALAAAFLAACGEDDSADDTTDASSSFPVTIDHHLGSTTIPSKPERVVIFGFNEQDSALALGVTPIAVRQWQDFPVGPWAEAAVGDAELTVLETVDADLEQVAALDPDLIIAVYYSLDEDEYGLLSQIAPTIARPTGYKDYNLPWDVQFATIGEALGASEEVGRISAELRDEFAAARSAHPHWEGLTFAFVGPRPEGSYRVRAANEQRARFFRDLGFVVPPEHESLAGDGFVFDLSPEEAQLLDVDVLIWSGAQSDVANDELLQHLDVVQGDHVVFADDVVLSALAFNSPLSLPFALKEMTPLLEAATASVA